VAAARREAGHRLGPAPRKRPECLHTPNGVRAGAPSDRAVRLRGTVADEATAEGSTFQLLASTGGQNPRRLAERRVVFREAANRQRRAAEATAVYLRVCRARSRPSEVGPSVVDRAGPRKRGREARSPRHHDAVASRRTNSDGGTVKTLECHAHESRRGRSVGVDAAVTGISGPGFQMSAAQMRPSSGKGPRPRMRRPPEGGSRAPYRSPRATRASSAIPPPLEAESTRLQHGDALNKRVQPDQAGYGRSSPDDPRRSSCGMSILETASRAVTVTAPLAASRGTSAARVRSFSPVECQRLRQKRDRASLGGLRAEPRSVAVTR
jgi:hypothetical protein